MSARPHSLTELRTFAKDDSVPDLLSLQDWLRVAHDFRLRGIQSHMKEEDLQAAFLFLSRSATYILDMIPHTAGYQELSPTQKLNLQTVCENFSYIEHRN
jgi:hypothetical protein